MEQDNRTLHEVAFEWLAQHSSFKDHALAGIAHWKSHPELALGGKLHVRTNYAWGSVIDAFLDNGYRANGSLTRGKASPEDLFELTAQLRPLAHDPEAIDFLQEIVLLQKYKVCLKQNGDSARIPLVDKRLSQYTRLIAMQLAASGKALVHDETIGNGWQEKPDGFVPISEPNLERLLNSSRPQVLDQSTLTGDDEQMRLAGLYAEMKLMQDPHQSFAPTAHAVMWRSLPEFDVAAAKPDALVWSECLKALEDHKYLIPTRGKLPRARTDFHYSESERAAVLETLQSAAAHEQTGTSVGKKIQNLALLRYYMAGACNLLSEEMAALHPGTAANFTPGQVNFIRMREQLFEIMEHEPQHVKSLAHEIVLTEDLLHREAMEMASMVNAQHESHALVKQNVISLEEERAVGARGGRK